MFIKVLQESRKEISTLSITLFQKLSSLGVKYYSYFHLSQHQLSLHSSEDICKDEINSRDPISAKAEARSGSLNSNRCLQLTRWVII